MTSAINHLAAILFITVMLIGMGSLLVHRVRLNRLPASLVNRRKAHVAATAADLLDGDNSSPLLPRSIYDHTVTALGDPKTIDTRLPCPPWPDAEARS